MPCSCYPANDVCPSAAKCQLDPVRRYRYLQSRKLLTADELVEYRYLKKVFAPAPKRRQSMGEVGSDLKDIGREGLSVLGYTVLLIVICAIIVAVLTGRPLF